MSKDDQKRPIRILHIVGGMDTGGVETWLMHVLRRIDRTQYRFDFLTHTTKPCFYDDEIRSLGGKIIPCLDWKRPWNYALHFLRVLKENGPYDIVHSHVHHFTGFTLMLARLAGVTMRIAHSHNDTSLHEGRAGFLRHCYLRFMEWLIHCHATKGLGCSGIAAADLFGKNWKKDSRWQILYCGIDLEPFSRPVDRNEVRRELGIPSDAFVVGHVGRFSEQKNHMFLIDIFAEVVRRGPNSRLLLVGDGELREEIEGKVKKLDLAHKVILAGVRPDVPRLMMGAMDVFLLPSFHEGLPLVLIEAQAAGLPCVYSEDITEEVNVLNNVVHRLSLEIPVSAWADRALNIKKSSPILPEKYSQVLEQSAFNIDIGVNYLINIYVGKN